MRLGELGCGEVWWVARCRVGWGMVDGAGWDWMGRGVVGRDGIGSVGVGNSAPRCVEKFRHCQ